MIRTRFAPSPTGFLHIGGARTALFCWAFARKHNGAFILRIEDTDLERSTQESVDSIIQAMNWLGLTYDEGPYYQTQRFDRYKEMIAQLVKEEKAYHCYCSREELDQMREEQKATGAKPRYDRRCLHNKTVKEGITPVIRFKNPDHGSVVWHDLVKGRIEISNDELDDLIIARSDGSPTYNFCVVIDDLDMKITHVVRGDDHVNNTPRQINILQAFNAKIPTYAHLPMILREDGKKMSKRTDAVSVMQYHEMGILPEALLNYLSRLCWGHGDDEIFNLEQFTTWFELDHVSGSPARFDMKKLLWVNKEHLQKMPNALLLDLVSEQLKQQNIDFSNGPQLLDVIEFVKPRADTINHLAKECCYFYKPLVADPAEVEKHITPESTLMLDKFATVIGEITSANWNIDSIKLAIKDFCTNNNLKMPNLGMPLRIKLCGTTQTPSFDMIISLLGQDEVLKRLRA